MSKPTIYPGHKMISGVFQRIINNIPEHKMYYELFAGSAAIAKLLIPIVPDVTYLLNDMDGKAIAKLRKHFGQFPENNIILSQHPAMEFMAMIDCMERIAMDSNLASLPKKSFIFLDPPYKHSTRPGSTKLYAHEMTDEQHQQMLATCVTLQANIMLVHPKCELYDTMLAGWRKIEYKMRYRTKTQIECMYMNYPEPRTLQTDIYLGKDCWDRQRIVRKAEALTNRLSKLPVLERNFIINTINKNL